LISTDKWKEKVKEIPTTQSEPSEKIVSESIQAKSKELKPIPPSSFSEEEEMEVVSTVQKQKMKPDSQISQPDEIISIPEEVVEKPKEIITYCKFCGLQLAELEKFCQQCGTIIIQN
jgi:hypothetical protein